MRVIATAQRIYFFRNLFARLEAIPGVQSVGGINYLPLSNSESLGMFQVDGYPNDKNQMAEGRWVTPQYFSAMRIPLVAGRTFTNAESSGLRTVVINQAFAKKYFANRNPIGGRINTDEHHTSMEHRRWRSLPMSATPAWKNLPRHKSITPTDTFDGGYIAVRSTLSG